MDDMENLQQLLHHPLAIGAAAFAVVVVVVGLLAWARNPNRAIDAKVREIRREVGSGRFDPNKP